MTDKEYETDYRVIRDDIARDRKRVEKVDHLIKEAQRLLGNDIRYEKSIACSNLAIAIWITKSDV